MFPAPIVLVTSIEALDRERHGLRFKRYPDRCYAVVIGKRRGPCGHDKPTALARYWKSGLIASARRDS